MRVGLDKELIRALAAEMLGRHDVEESVLKETATRLAGVLARVRLADESAMAAVPPAFSFDPAHPHYQARPQVSPAPWNAIAQAGGGTGYGGAPGPAQAPRTGAPPSAALAPPSHGLTPTGPTSAPEYLFWPAVRLAGALRRGDLAPVEVTRASLDRIAATEPMLNAYVTVMADAALAQARHLQEQGPGGPLWGLPVGLKDLFETAGVRTTAGSQILADYIPERDATTVSRIRQAGGVIIGKTATHEFAFGPTTDTPFHGPVHNPWRLDCVPGGSSGGSGAAVSAGSAALAMGTDTGGSIRMPASCCGVVGLKPTYGRVSKAGVLPLSWSLDHAGPLARTVADAALMLGVLAGPDPLDPTALPVPVDDYLTAATGEADLKGVQIGLPVGWLQGPIDPEVQARFGEALIRLQELGARVVEVTLPPAEVMSLVNRLLALAEAGAYHAPHLKGRAPEYSADVRARLELGQYLLARDYLLAHRLRTEMARHLHEVMSRVDLLVTPTMPIPPGLIHQATWTYPDGRTEAVVEAMIRFSAPFSVTGQPAISLPCGFTAGGLPVGLQLIGRPFGEAALLRVAGAFERASGPLFQPPI